MEPMKKKPPKLLACMTKASLENMRNQQLYSINMLDARGIRRQKMPLNECIVLELMESGYTESAFYLQDLLYDNAVLIKEDEIGIVVDLKKQNEYLEDIAQHLIKAEDYKDRDDKEKEAIELLELAVRYSQKGKGILWLAEKFFLVAIAVASQYLLDGGRQKACCKYHYAKFLLDKFPEADTDEAFGILTEIRDASVGKTWKLYEPGYEDRVAVLEPDVTIRNYTVVKASAIQLHRVLLDKARHIRKRDPAKAERMSRLAERRAIDADIPEKIAEAKVEIGISQLMMNNLNNAMKTFEKALAMQIESNYIIGICETKMHLSAVLQKMGDIHGGVQLLTEMGTLAIKNNLRLHLGRALYLLGELYLKHEKPEFGTLHLFEAFQCFMGFGFHESELEPEVVLEQNNFGVVFTSPQGQKYLQEAEQARLLMAVSAGQEYMMSYMDLLNEAAFCTVAQAKVVEWKLAHRNWWVYRHQYNYIPCMCYLHMRTPLDVINLQLQHLVGPSHSDVNESQHLKLDRGYTMQDILMLRSSTTRYGSDLSCTSKSPSKKSVKEKSGSKDIQKK